MLILVDLLALFIYILLFNYTEFKHLCGVIRLYKLLHRKLYSDVLYKRK